MRFGDHCCCKTKSRDGYSCSISLNPSTCLYAAPVKMFK